MIYIYEPSCVGFQHAVFNSLFINSLSIAFGSDICFFSEKTHGELVKERLELANVNILYRDRIVYNDSNKFQRFSHIRKQYKTLISEAKKNKVASIFITVTRKYEILILNSFARTFSGNIYLLFHAHLALVMNSWFYRTMMKNKTAQNVFYMVLSKKIKESICSQFPKLDKKIIFVRHTLPFDGPLANHEVDTRMIKFGFIGIATHEKGMEKICSIVAKSSNNAQFFYCGVIHDEEVQDTLKRAGVIVKGGTNPLSFDEYKESIQSLDYVILLLERNAYEYRVSGTLIDAVNNERPIIVLKNKYSEEVFEEFGGLGYLCCDDSCIVETINRITTHFDQKEYNSQVSQMRLMKKKLTPELVASEIQEQILG